MHDITTLLRYFVTQEFELIIDTYGIQNERERSDSMIVAYYCFHNNIYNYSKKKLGNCLRHHGQCNLETLVTPIHPGSNVD